MKFLELRDGLVYRKSQNKRLLCYVPASMENNVIRTCHDDLGRFGVDKVVHNVYKVCWFPQMRKKIGGYIENCLRYVEFSPMSGKRDGYLHNISKGDVPFHTLHIDHCGPIEKTSKGHKHVLVIDDDFTKFVKTYRCKSTISSKLKHIIFYRGTAFTSETFKEFMRTELTNYREAV